MVGEENKKQINIKMTIIYYIYYIFWSFISLYVPYLFFKNLLNLHWLSLCYLFWYLYDFQTCQQGSRLIPFLRKLSFWPLLSKSFPFKLIKTKDLPTNRNYIFACHPHGIFSVSAMQCFTSESCGFSKLFPGLRSYMVTITYQFLIPVYRELLLLLGFISSSADSIEYVLRMKPYGNVVSLMIGGTREAIDSDNDKQMVIVAKKRRGFLRLALKNRASIVPVICFGENNLYQVIKPTTSKSSSFSQLQKWFQSTFGLPLIFFYGHLGLFPNRKPVSIVVGEPILIEERIEKPTEQDLDQLQQKYLNSLQKLYDEHKHNYNHQDVQLVIV